MTSATLICADGTPVTIVNVPAWVMAYAKHKAAGGTLSLAAWLGEHDPATLAALEAEGALSDPMTADPICSICGRPVAEDQDCVDTDHQGLVHGECWDAWAAEDPAGNEADFWFERAGDR